MWLKFTEAFGTLFKGVKMSSTNNNHATEAQQKYTGGGVSPYDSAIIPVTDPSQTVIDPQVYIEGCPIKKTEVEKKADDIWGKYRRQILFSLVRNILCWTFAITLLVMLAQAQNIRAWHVDKVASVAIPFAFGLIGLFFHIYRGYYDLTYHNPTIVALLLRDAMTVDDFTRRMQTYELTAPELLIQVSLRSGTISYGDPNHWTRGSRKTGKELTYRGWSDQSPGVRHVSFPADATSMVLVKKDFRLVDDASRMSLEQEVSDFRRDTGYDSNSYYMNMEYILNWKDADACPDAKVYLLFDSCRPYFYMFQIYRLCWFLAMDSVYRIAFHLNTKHIPEYTLVKFIER